MNTKARLDKAIEQARALLDTKRQRDDPRLGAAWWEESQERLRTCLEQLNALDGLDSESAAAISELVTVEANCLEWMATHSMFKRSYPTFQMGWLDVIASWMALTPPALRAEASRLMLRNSPDRRGELLADWVRALAFRRVAIPEEATMESHGAMVRAIITCPAHELWPYASWCGGCLMFSPQKEPSRSDGKGLLSPCPLCGFNEPWQHVYHTEGKTRTVPASTKGSQNTITEEIQDWPQGTRAPSSGGTP